MGKPEPPPLYIQGHQGEVLLTKYVKTDDAFRTPRKYSSTAKANLQRDTLASKLRKRVAAADVLEPLAEVFGDNCIMHDFDAE